MRVESQKNINKRGVLLLNLNTIKYEWFGNMKGDILSGLVVAFALIPEATGFSIIKTLSAKGSHKKVYHVSGQLFFASVTDFVNHFDFKEDISEIDLDLSNAHLWDDSAIAAIDKVVIKYHQNGVKVNLKGLNTDSMKLLDKLAAHKLLMFLKRFQIISAKNAEIYELHPNC